MLVYQPPFLNLCKGLSSSKGKPSSTVITLTLGSLLDQLLILFIGSSQDGTWSPFQLAKLVDPTCFFWVTYLEDGAHT